MAFLAFGLISPSPLQAGFIDHLASMQDIGPAKIPHEGRSRILVIPVQLDRRNREAPDLSALENFFRDTPEAPERLSFPMYWSANSLGKFMVEAAVADPVRIEGCPFHPLSANCTPIRGDFTALAAGIPLVKRVILTALDQNGWSLRDFDLNGPDRKPDGYADGIILILNVGWFGVALPFGLIDSRFIVEQDGVKATLAAIASGPRALGMSLHEFGHLLGFADLYDEWGMTYGLGMSLMGRWDYDLRTTPLLDAFSRVMIGWARLERITGQREVWLAPVLSSGRVIQLGGGDEFFLVENRSPIPPFDGGLKRSGLAIYQVNLERLPDREGFDFIRTVLDCPNCRPFRPLVMNVQADGRFDLQVRTHPFEAEEDLFHTGDALLPRPEGPPLSRSNLLLSTNQSNGKPTQTMVVQIDSDSYQPMIRATFAAPFPRNPCDRLQRPPDPSCLEGARRPPLESDFGPPPGPPRAALPALAASAPGCFSLGEYLDWRILSIILLILWLILRPLLKRRYEERLRKQGLLKKDENVKGRFEK